MGFSFSPNMGPRSAIREFGETAEKGAAFSGRVIRGMLAFVRPYWRRMVAASLLTLAACAKGQIGAGSNTSFGVGMSTSSSSTSGNDSADDRSDESESESDEDSNSDSNSGASSGASSGAETCGVGCSEQCGNGAIDDGEDCDGTELGGMDCVALGLAGGTLACSGCTFDTSM